MYFDKENYSVNEVTVQNQTITFRAYRDRLYVEKPVNEEYQSLNIFVPEDYYKEIEINGYHLKDAPIFVPNTVGGYMPGKKDEPGVHKRNSNQPNTIFKALQHGYIVVSPGIRGRTLTDKDGNYNGKAPACIVDYKAVIRYLRYFKDWIPGDTNKIITNGTSAGGALSSLMGATGNHKDYEPYLKEIGAAETSDAIFGASCYCPITNLEHADMAYEWQFLNINEFHRMKMSMDEGGRPAFSAIDGMMTNEQIIVSKELSKLFKDYINSLHLKDADRKLLLLDEKGNGSFKEYIGSLLINSAQNALDKGTDISDKSWITINNNKVTQINFDEYVKDITRMKEAPAFDHLSLQSPENDLFGTNNINAQHFTNYSEQHSKSSGAIADKKIIKMMNPMNYIDDQQALTAKHWRIRHGECDRDTSLAISAILSIKLKEFGCDVDYQLPWNIPHSGDYDLDELFKWIDSICK